MRPATKQVTLAVVREEADKVLWWKTWQARPPRALERQQHTFRRLGRAQQNARSKPGFFLQYLYRFCFCDQIHGERFFRTKPPLPDQVIFFIFFYERCYMFVFKVPLKPPFLTDFLHRKIKMFHLSTTAVKTTVFVCLWLPYKKQEIVNHYPGVF